MAKPGIALNELKIKELREKKGWSQAVLAKKCGYRRSLISNAENGRRVSEDARLCLAKALECSPDDLLQELRTDQTTIRPGLTRIVTADGKTQSLMLVDDMVIGIAGLHGAQLYIKNTFIGRLIVYALLYISGKWGEAASVILWLDTCGFIFLSIMNVRRMRHLTLEIERKYDLEPD